MFENEQKSRSFVVCREISFLSLFRLIETLEDKVTMLVQKVQKNEIKIIVDGGIKEN